MGIIQNVKATDSVYIQVSAMLTKSNTSESLKKVLAGQIFYLFIYCPACLKSLEKDIPIILGNIMK